MKRASDGFMLQAFQYTSTNARLMDYDTGVGLTKIFASVGGTVVAEYAELQHTVPTWTKGYTYLGDSLLATITPAGSGSESVEFNHPDRLSTKLITNPQTGGNSEQAHLPFGKALNSESTVTNNPRRFTSYDRSNSTGLDYAINRTYDSKQGRFTQVDPIGMQAASIGAPQTLNLYTYCGNDPVNRVDPSGLFWGWISKFFSWIVNTIRTSKVVRRIVVRFVVSFVMSGGNLGVAVRSIIPDILAALGLAPPSFALTPSWNPNLPYPVTFGVGSLSRYIIRNLDSVRLLKAINACIMKVFGAKNLIATAFRAATRKRNGLMTLKNSQGTFNIETGINFDSSNIGIAYGVSKGKSEFNSELDYGAVGMDGFAPEGRPGSTFSFRGGTYSNDPRRANYVANDARKYSKLDHLLGSGIVGKQIHEGGHSLATIVGTAGDGALREDGAREDYGYPFQNCVEAEYRMPGSY